VELGRFREDLFFRLDYERINIPPLRERKEDIPELIRFFVDSFVSREGRGKKIEIEDEFIKVLVEHSWHGNVRELKAVISRAMNYLHNGKLTVDSLKDENWVTGLKDDYRKLVEEHSELFKGKIKTLEEMEKIYIEYVIKKFDGNKAEAARHLGLKKTTLHMKLKRWGMK
jgi:DNA-binding NtrC family response regulator